VKVPLRHDLSAGPVLLACLAIGLLTLMDGVAKELSTRLTTLDVVTIRYVSGIFWAGLLGLIVRPPLPTRDMVRAHSIRAVFFASTSFLFFYALSTLPIVEAMVFTYLSPIFIALLGSLLLHEKVHPSTAFAIALSFVGVMVIAVGKGLGAEGISNDFLGILAAIGSAGTYALSLVLLRARTGSDPITTIVVLQNFLTALIILPIAFFLSDPVAAIVAEWPYVLMMGLLGTAGQFALASALRAAPAARIGTVEFTNIIWATLIGIFFFGEWPGITAYLGAALIIFAAFILLRKAPPKISIAGDGL